VSLSGPLAKPLVAASGAAQNFLDLAAADAAAELLNNETSLVVEEIVSIYMKLDKIVCAEETP